MAWKVELTETSKRVLRKLDKTTAVRITKYLHELASQADPRTKGKALSGDLRTFWRYRVGDYRLICDIVDDKLILLVLRIGHRTDVYDP